MEVQIPELVFKKIMRWVNKSDQEVSGFGKVKYYPETGVFEVIDAYLVKQENGMSHTDINGQALAKLMYTTRDVEGELKWWWHSHVDMPVFWSGTDTATIKDLGKQGWMLASVFNKSEEIRSALGYKVTSEFGDTVNVEDELKNHIMVDVNEELQALWDKEYDENVEAKKQGSFPSYYGSTIPVGTECNGWMKTEAGWTRLGNSNGNAASSALTSAATEDGEGTIVDATEERDERALMEMAERQQYVNEGWWGFGGAREAQALGMTLPAYVDKLVECNPAEIRKIETKMDRLIQQGKLT